MVEVAFEAIERRLGQLDGEVENGCVLGVESGAFVIERDPISKDGIAESLAQCGAGGDQAIETAVGHGGCYGDHLALGGVEIVGGLVKLLVVREPGGEAFRAIAVNFENVWN